MILAVAIIAVSAVILSALIAYRLYRKIEWHRTLVLRERIIRDHYAAMGDMKRANIHHAEVQRLMDEWSKLLK